jgi:hypothetical protein
VNFTEFLKRLAALKTMRPAATGSWCQLVYGGPPACPWNPMLKVAHTCGREKT